MKGTVERFLRGEVHCPICTHTVPAAVENGGRRVVAGQKCPRCSAKLDAAVVVRTLQAAA